jgi:FkbM family methyltransferase
MMDNMYVQTLVRALPPFLRRHKLLRAFARLGDPIQPATFNENGQVFVDLRDGPMRNLLMNGVFDPEYFRIASAFLRDGGTSFDVGANAGLCSFGLIPLCRNVDYHLFEANPKLWPLLKRSIALHPQVSMHLVEAAVGERAGKVFIGGENVDQDIGQGFIHSEKGVETRMLTLDEYFRSSGVARVDFMKMDIEGYELFAIEGARDAIRERRLPVIYFELKGPLVARFGKTPSDVLERFRSLGYRLYHVRDQDFDTITTPRDVDVRGLRVAPVGEYPENLWADLLAVHESEPLARG